MRLALVLLVVACVYAYGRHVDLEAASKNGVLCSVCKKLVDKITPFVQATNITEIAYEICADISLTKSLEQLCDNFVDDSIGVIVSDIQGGKTDTQTCTDLHAC